MRFIILFYFQGHTLFITSAFAIRIIEALGNAAFLTASFAIIAKEFPKNVSVTFASLETFFGLGLIVGPMVGGLLYSIGGYYLPFVSLGLLLLLTALITMCILPKHDNVVLEESSKGMLWILIECRMNCIILVPFLATVQFLMKIPGVLVCALSIMATSASIGFLGATLEPHLRQFDLTAILLGEIQLEAFWFWHFYKQKSSFAGIIFIINGGFYALTAPIWGLMVDKWLNPKWAAFLGSLMISVAFCLIGPASFLPFLTWVRLSFSMPAWLSNWKNKKYYHSQDTRFDYMWISNARIGHSCNFSSQFHWCSSNCHVSIKSKLKQLTLCIFIAYIHKIIIIYHECRHRRGGLPDSIETYGLVSGLWTSTFAFGAFLGPSVSGLLYDSIGFRKAVIFIIILHLVVAFIVLITIIFERNPQPYKELGQAEPLLRNHESVLFDRA